MSHPPVSPAAEAYHILTEKRARNNASSAGSAFLFFASLLLFVGSHLIEEGDPAIVIPIISVLFIHELGHLIAMKVCGFRNLSLVFLPLTGGAATGDLPWDKPVLLARQTAIALAGPLPGVFIGVVLLSYYLMMPSADASVLSFALFFIVVNEANLIPLNPLDGGRIVRYLLPVSWTIAQAIHRNALTIIGGIALLLVHRLEVRIVGIALVALSVRRVRDTLWVCRLASDARLSTPPHSDPLTAIAALARALPWSAVPSPQRRRGLLRDSYNELLLSRPNRRDRAVAAASYAGALLFLPSAMIFIRFVLLPPLTPVSLLQLQMRLSRQGHHYLALTLGDYYLTRVRARRLRYARHVTTRVNQVSATLSRVHDRSDNDRDRLAQLHRSQRRIPLVQWRCREILLHALTKSGLTPDRHRPCQRFLRGRRR